MSIAMVKHTTTVRGRSVIIAVVAVVCDNCGGHHVRADAWDYDSEMAVSEAVNSGLWIVEDADDEEDAFALCGSCRDGGVSMGEVKDRFRRCIDDRTSFVTRFIDDPINSLNNRDAYVELGSHLQIDAEVSDDDLESIAVLATNEDSVGVATQEQMASILAWMREGQRSAPRPERKNDEAIDVEGTTP